MNKLNQESNIIIKQLTKEETIHNFDNIVDLLQQSYKISFAEHTIEKEYFENKVKNLVNYISENKAIVYGAFNKKLIGILWCYPRMLLNEKRLHVNHFVVNELSRGLGVGTMLMKEVEQYAKDNEIKSIDLMVTSSSHSVKFYERNGFCVERYQMFKRL